MFHSKNNFLELDFLRIQEIDYYFFDFCIDRKKVLEDYYNFLFSFFLVGEERIELSLLAKHDFESCASTSSAIRPLV